MEKENAGDLLARRHQKLTELRERGIDPYPNDFRITHTVAEIQARAAEEPEALGEEEPVFSVAGRMMAVNRFGKSSFIRFRDRTGQLQAYIRKDKVGDEAYALFKQLDVGDILGLRGGMFQTRTGEWTLLAHEIQLLCKATRPLPEKFHG
ncbi:MAG: OB-fold nucleic acid binding domain-containing protein, partial [Desulfococcaceae bacterium]